MWADKRKFAIKDKKIEDITDITNEELFVICRDFNNYFNYWDSKGWELDEGAYRDIFEELSKVNDEVVRRAGTYTDWSDYDPSDYKNVMEKAIKIIQKKEKEKLAASGTLRRNGSNF